MPKVIDERSATCAIGKCDKPSTVDITYGGPAPMWIGPPLLKSYCDEHDPSAPLPEEA